MTRPPVLRVVEREWRVWRRLWRASVFSALVSPVLFLAAMGLGLGGLVQEGSGKVEGLSYLEFVAPGLLAATCALQAATESLWPVVAGVKWLRTYHAAAATPVTADDIFVAHLVWIALRILLSASVFLVVAAILGALVSPWAVLAIPAAVLGALALAAPVTAFSVNQDSDLPLMLVLRLGVFPLFLFSGTFFPVSQLPDWAERIALLSPLYHTAELCRGFTTGSIDLVDAAGNVVALLAFVAAGYVWGVRSFERRLYQ
jgi:lipooligosaccharide transport system permease protein